MNHGLQTSAPLKLRSGGWAWIDNYFIPQKARQEEFLKKHAGNKTVENMIAFLRREADLYSKYKQYYGYVFYIGKKIWIKLFQNLPKNTMIRSMRMNSFTEIVDKLMRPFCSRCFYGVNVESPYMSGTIVSMCMDW